MALDYSLILNKPDFGRQMTDAGLKYAQIKAARAQADQAEQQGELQAAQAARAQEYLGALRSAESPQAMAQLAQQYPEQLEQLKGIAGFQNELQAQAVGEVAMNLSNLAQTDPQAAQAYLMENAEVLRTMGPGYEPEALIEALKTDPAEFAKRADMMGVISLGPEKAQEIIGQRKTQDLAERKFGETQQQNRFDQGIKKQELGLKQQELRIKANESRASAIRNQISQETNQIKLEQLRQNLATAEREAESAKLEKQVAGEAAIATSERGIDLIESIRTSPGFSSAVGAGLPLARIPGTEARETAAMIDTLKSQVFLSEVSQMKGMGALTEAEGKKLETSIASLDTGMPEDAFRRNLKIIEDSLRSAQRRTATEYGVTPPPAPTALGGGGATGSFAPSGGAKFLGFE